MSNNPAQAIADFDSAVQYVDGLLATAPDTVGGGLEALAAFGSYEGTPAQIELDDNGRSARLLRAITYHSPTQMDWPVPVDAWLDGASIPRAFWTIIGGPFEGKYRAASIVHDHYCITRTRTWRDTHRMFHDAMRCSEVSKAQATVMYYAVYRFGPRWSDPGLEGLEIAPDETSDDNAASFAQDAQRIVLEGLGPEAAAALAESRRG
jgi:hypothetical protein